MFEGRLGLLQDQDRGSRIEDRGSGDRGSVKTKKVKTEQEEDQLDQFSFLGNRARYEFIELDMSTRLDLSIPSSRPLTFPGEQI